MARIPIRLTGANLDRAWRIWFASTKMKELKKEANRQKYINIISKNLEEIIFSLDASENSTLDIEHLDDHDMAFVYDEAAIH